MENVVLNSRDSKFIASIIEAHGGAERFSKLSSIDIDFDFTGALLDLKARHTHLTPHASISTTEQKITQRGLGGPSSEDWIFVPSKVYKQSTSTGEVLESRDNPFASFIDRSRRAVWDDFHFLYFTGYALWQYFNFPYLLTRDDLAITELAPHEERGEVWRVLEVTFPDQATLASHNKLQRFYFNDKLELVRHDYCPDVLTGAWAAHYTFDNIIVGGLKFPTRRRVVRLGADGKPSYNGPTLVHIVLTKLQLRGDHGLSNVESSWALTHAPAPTKL